MVVLLIVFINFLFLFFLLLVLSKCLEFVLVSLFFERSKFCARLKFFSALFFTCSSSSRVVLCFVLLLVLV